ncbi:DUF4288 domain-containing protein [Ammoniphilus sp. YIM 78166]|uniref:DUF4288 domain-containing protein n=1 Tax=Ammoniphilus sp. YIM 78166 TaxID=1644106 RepID=UPI00106F5618|nr:DUF4288 domain-containing protein [Ammoniphilus sp. YIM 78166]
MWYSTAVLFRLEQMESLPTYCETLVLFNADSDDEAYLLAEQWGKEYEDEIWETNGNKTRWVYEQVLDVWELFDEKIASGTEVYSRVWASPPFIED